MSGADFEVIRSEDARATPVRVCVVQEEARPPVDLHDDDLVMSFPHLVVRELIVVIGASLALVLLALAMDAPLEELANPLKTPNPAKAPWYFLGLQELLHYYPPLVSGVILPGIAILGLAIVPYFDINLTREPFWETNRDRKIRILLLVILLACAFFFVSGAHPVWPIIGPTLAIGGLMLWPALAGTGTPVRHWLGTRSLAFWVFSWFLASSVTLTLIGVFFRGPGWSLTLPWREGVY